MFMDGDHLVDKVSCRSRSGFFIYMNIPLVQWSSKKQSTVEAEFVTMNQGIDALRGLRYKFRMMGSLISGPSYIDKDNMSVV